MILQMFIDSANQKRAGKWLIKVAYLDQARLVEWLSVCWLLNFGFEFMFNPALAARDSYAGFTALGMDRWAIYTFVAALCQFGGIFWVGRWRDDLRFIAMLASFAFWVAVAAAFWSSGVQTTANNAYTAFALSTFFAAGFLLWKSTAKA